MVQSCRREVEWKQYDILCALSQYINDRNPSILDDSELEAVGVVRWTNLDIDSQSPCNFQPRFFCPYHDEDSGLEEEAKQARGMWRETLDDQKHIDPEWVENAGYIYATMRAEWFDNILLRLRYHYEGQTHPMYVGSSPRLSLRLWLTLQPSNMYEAVDQEDMGFAAPIGGDFSNTMYVTKYYQVPTATDKPHMGIIMLDPNVAPEGKMLWSELDVAVTLLQEKIRSGRFTNHHTKPVSPDLHAPDLHTPSRHAPRPLLLPITSPDYHLN